MSLYIKKLSFNTYKFKISKTLIDDENIQIILNGDYNYLKLLYNYARDEGFNKEITTIFDLYNLKYYIQTIDRFIHSKSFKKIVDDKKKQDIYYIEQFNKEKDNFLISN